MSAANRELRAELADLRALYEATRSAVRIVRLHARQGQLQPELAKDHCREIEEALSTLADQ
jgi:hypothetical protein